MVWGDGTGVRPGLKPMSTLWVLFLVTLEHERRMFKPLPAQRGP